MGLRCSDGVGWAIAMQLIWVTGAVGGEILILGEDFSDDPVASNRAVVSNVSQAGRFSHDAVEGALIASYHSALPTAKLLWSLGLDQPLTQADSFAFSVTFTILNDGAYFADNTGGVAQIAFGLVNSSTTSDSRVGAPPANVGDPFVPSDTYDIVTVDYFPNDNPFFDSISLTPTVFHSQLPGSGDAFDGIEAPFDQESQTADTSEEVGVLALDQPYTVRLSYEGPSRSLTVTLEDGNGQVVINQVGKDNTTGGPDGDVHTIQHVLPQFKEFPADSNEFVPLAFELDSFGILLWQDGFNKAFSSNDSLIANVAFKELTVVRMPEPTSAVVLGVLGLWLVVSRRRCYARSSCRNAEGSAS